MDAFIVGLLYTGVFVGAALLLVVAMTDLILQMRSNWRRRRARAGRARAQRAAAVVHLAAMNTAQQVHADAWQARQALVREALRASRELDE